MTYSSPLKLFPDIPPAPDSSFWIGLKKRMLAEFQLNDEKPLLIEGAYYSKDQIVNLIDSLKESNDLPHHVLIWQDKNLLTFLEKKQIPGDFYNWSHYLSNEAFITFVSPYFLESYSSLVNDAFKKQESFILQKLIQRMPMLVSPEDSASVYSGIQRSVYRTIKELNLIVNQIETKSFSDPIDSLRKYYHADFIACLNLLPDSFVGQRNQLSIELINLYVHCYNILKKPSLSKDIILQASKLKVEAYERSLLNERMEEIKKLQTGSGSSSDSSDSTNIWTVLKIVGFVIYFLVMVGRACSRNERSSSFDYKSPNPLSSVNELFDENQSIVFGISTSAHYGEGITEDPTISMRPQTGVAIYNEEKLPNAGNVKLIVVNESDMDAVVFIKNQNILQRYIQAHDSLLIASMVNGEAEIYCYRGKNWNQQLCFNTIGNNNKRLCGKFKDPHSKTTIQTTFYLSETDSNNITLTQRVSIQDSTLEISNVRLSNKKINKMRNAEKVLTWSN